MMEYCESIILAFLKAPDNAFFVLNLRKCFINCVDFFRKTRQLWNYPVVTLNADIILLVKVLILTFLRYFVSFAVI